MVDIQKQTYLSEDGTEIGQTQIAWIPEVLEAIINQDESDNGKAYLIKRLPENLQTEFINDITLTYSQFKRYQDHPPTPFIQTPNLSDEYIRNHLKRYQNDFEGYLTYLQANQNKLTQFFFRWFTARLPLSQVHTYIVGGSGSGKSELMKNMIYDRLKRRKSAVIVLDPKGDLAKQVASWKDNALDPDRLVYFDPFLLPNHTPVLNPFDIRDKNPKTIQTASFEMRETFDMILRDIDGGFTPKMKNILGHTLSVVMRKEGGSLSDLKRFFNEATNQDLLKLGQTAQDEQDRAFFQHEFADLNPETLAGLSSRLGLLLQNKTFRDMTTGKSTIDLGQAIRDKKLIVFNLSKGAVTRDYSKFFGKIVVSLILIQAMQNANNIEEEHKRPKIDLFIDEFQNYITPAVGEIVAEARAYGVRLTVATQLVGQDMSTSLEKLILTNTDTKIIGWSSIENRSIMGKQFGMKPEDLETKKRTFWARIANGSPFKTKTSSRLAGQNNAMTKDEWRDILQHQKQYYRTFEKPKQQTEAPPPDIDQEQYFDRKYKPKIDL
jgi:hypothetical protein